MESALTLQCDSFQCFNGMLVAACLWCDSLGFLIKPPQTCVAHVYFRLHAFPSISATDAGVLNAVHWQQEFGTRDQTHSTAPSFR